jgi:hypothetical protein
LIDLSPRCSIKNIGCAANSAIARVELRIILDITKRAAAPALDDAHFHPSTDFRFWSLDTGPGYGMTSGFFLRFLSARDFDLSGRHSEVASQRRWLNSAHARAHRSAAREAGVKAALASILGMVDRPAPGALKHVLSGCGMAANFVDVGATRAFPFYGLARIDIAFNFVACNNLNGFFSCAHF